MTSTISFRSSASRCQTEGSCKAPRGTTHLKANSFPSLPYSKSTGNDNNNTNSTSSNHELINKSDSAQSSSGTIWKNVGTGDGEKKKSKVSRKYHSYYLKFGFIEKSDSELDSRPLCVVCSESLSNDALKPSKLERHLNLEPPDLAKKPLECLKRMQENMEKQIIVLRKMTMEDKSHY
ncbi:DUF4371 domain-containing protein [Trichonephila clavata]|uniref:DUF4371 domain-containing protein n=1 Tax=Trichonephila clavata TaxID=2740835 RepID=A0A8X6F5Q3_TRICU|nr:DUF4371 domain-containing protein [Trichonephila clavata]